MSEGTDFENEVTIGLVRAGTCFVVYEIGKEIRFAQNRFVGNVNNNLNQHLKSYKDGRDKNVAIQRIMVEKYADNSSMEIAFIKYYKNSGIELYNRKRKYWKFKLTKEFSAKMDLDGEFTEGKV